MLKSPTVELTIPVLPDMELAATKTAEVVAKHMDLDDEQTAEISMALIEACLNAFEHSKSKEQVEIHFKIQDDRLIIQVTDKGKGFDKSKVKILKVPKNTIIKYGAVSYETCLSMAKYLGKSLIVINVTIS